MELIQVFPVCLTGRNRQDVCAYLEKRKEISDHILIRKRRDMSNRDFTLYFMEFFFCLKTLTFGIPQKVMIIFHSPQRLKGYNYDVYYWRR